MLSRSSADRSGTETSPRSGPARSPAAKFSPTSWTPALRTAPTNASTSPSAGTGWSGHGHQNSTASNPAAFAAAGRSSTGSSVNRIEQLTSQRSE
jgi:hypothetical protein